MSNIERAIELVKNLEVDEEYREELLQLLYKINCGIC